MKRVALICVLFLLVLACCKDDSDDQCWDVRNPRCENYDPCYGLEKPSARFIMEEGGILEWEDGEQVWRWFADSIFAGGNVRFRSELINTSEYQHTWYVGTETFTNVAETPGRNFSDVPRPNQITISHVIKYTPDSQCFPNDNGRDSVAQTFRLIGDAKELRTYGTFEGKLNDTGQVYQFQIIPIRKTQTEPLQLWPAWGRATEIITINFFNLGDTLYTSSNQGRMDIRGFHAAWWFKDWNSNYYAGDGIIDSDGYFTMEFVDNRPPYNDAKPEYTLKGKKID